MFRKSIQKSAGESTGQDPVYVLDHRRGLWFYKAPQPQSDHMPAGVVVVVLPRCPIAHAPWAMGDPTAHTATRDGPRPGHADGTRQAPSRVRAGEAKGIHLPLPLTCEHCCGFINQLHTDARTDPEGPYTSPCANESAKKTNIYKLEACRAQLARSRLGLGLT